MSMKRFLPFATGVLFLLLGCTSVKVSKPMLKMIVDATIKLSEAPAYADS